MEDLFKNIFEIKNIKDVIKSCNANIVGNNNSISMSSRNGKSTIKMNGRTITVTGNSVNIINGKIYVDGKEYTEQPDIKKETVIIQIVGQVDKLTIDSSVEIAGNIKANDITIRGNVNCNDIHGNVTADMVNCDDIYGKARANMINADNIKE